MAFEPKSRLEAIRATAASWVVRLSDPNCGDADRAAFAQWRDQSPEHRLAYERERLAWERLDRLQALRPAMAVPDPDLLAPPRSPMFRFPIKASRPLRWAAAACMTIAVAGALALGLQSGTAYATAVGERRVVVLPDHSRVELNTDTKIVVLFRGGRRKVRLVQGEAMFDVAKGDRPFEVVSGDALVSSEAAQFDVRLDEAHLAVAVPGVATLQLASGEILTLTREKLDLDSTGRPLRSPMSVEQLKQELAWRQDGIDLTGRTVSQAAAEFNRYNGRQIVIVDPSIAALRMAGYFRTNDVDGFVQALTLTFPVRAQTPAPDRITLSRRG